MPPSVTAIRWTFAIAFTCASAPGQSEACDAATAIAKEERNLAAQHDSAKLSAAASTAKLWTLLIAPETAYLDRLAAAHRGGAVFPPSFLPRIWTASAEVEGIPSVVGLHPCYPFWHHRAAFLDPPGRAQLLGKPVDARRPQDLPAYPVTPEQRSAAPWEWQMGQAFEILNGQLASRYHRSPSQYRLLLRQAWRWTPADRRDDVIWERAILHNAPHNVDWVRAVLRLSAIEIPRAEFEVRATHRTRPTGSSPLDSTAVQAVYALDRDDNENSPHAEALIQAASIAILQSTSEWIVAQAVRLRATPARSVGILALGKWALDQRLSPSTRLLFAREICRLAPAADGTPINAATALPEAGSREETQVLARFAQWFRANEPGWMEDAAAELPELRRLGAELRVKIASPRAQ